MRPEPRKPRVRAALIAWAVTVAASSCDSTEKNPQRALEMQTPPRAATPERPRPLAPSVVVVVLNGLRPDMINPAVTPALHLFRESGVELTDNHAVFPTNAIANAASLSTGAYPGVHGLFGPLIYRPGIRGQSGRGTFLGDTPFVSLEDYGALDALGAGRKLLGVPSLGRMLKGGGLVLATLGKAGPAYLQDPDRLGFIADDDFLWPERSLLALMAKAAAVPRNTAFVYPHIDLSGNSDPTRIQLGDTATSFTLDSDGAAPGSKGVNPDDLSGSPFATTDDYHVRLLGGNHVLQSERPDVLVFHLHDPGDTGAIYGLGSNNHLQALKRVDALFDALLNLLAVNGGSHSNVIVLSSHGASHISGPTNLFPLKGSGFSASGEVRLIDLLTASGVVAYDGAECAGSALLGGRMGPGNKTVYNHLATVDEQVRCQTRETLQILSVKDPLPSPPPAGAVVVAVNGGSDLLYLLDGDRELATKVVRALQGRMEVGPIFVAGKFGPIPGTLPLAAVGLEGENAPNGGPDIVVSYDWNADTRIKGMPGISYAGVLSRRASAGSFSPRDIRTLLMARGPAFRAAHKSRLPSGVVDVAPTIAHILGVPMVHAQGRPLLEALVGPAPDPDAYVAEAVLAPEVPATGLEIRLPTSVVPGAATPPPGPEHFDRRKSAYTMEVRTKTVVQRGRSFTYYDYGRAIRH